MVDMTPYVNFSSANSKNIGSPRPIYKNLCFVSVLFAFVVGLLLGIFLPLVYYRNSSNSTSLLPPVNETSEIRSVFMSNSFSAKNLSEINNYPTVSFVENFKVVGEEKDGKLIRNGIYWGDLVEKSLPDGYREKKHALWRNYVDKAVAVKMETGCGRMQNRLVVFQDGLKGCVRYRQNTDQIQGELFSFYLAQILKLPNLAPSTVSIVDLRSPLWSNVRNEIAAAQWNSNRAIVLTQFISDLGTANIPDVFRPTERHLNKFDVLNMTKNEIREEVDLTRTLVELAQWSDLIIFDYLTANLDRIVNNLYNYQWNANIMDAPAHNLAKKSGGDLLVFLDNESGLLHGYRLLKKYEVYHSVLLENLCVFRKQTADVIRELRARGDVGRLLRERFESQNSAAIKDILPSLPEKSVKVLNERIEKVYAQISKCESIYADQSNA